MAYALFLGCTIPARSRNYELSARAVAQKLAIDLVDLKDFLCCGFPVKASDEALAETLGAYNLALAKKEGLDVCVLCSSCASALTEVSHHLSGDGEAVERVNRRLAKVGLRYEGGVRVRHFARLLCEEIGEDRIKASLKRDLGGLRVGVHYGCHYIKPSEIYDHFDSVEEPRSIDSLVRLTGAAPVDYPGKKRCCGGPVLPVDEKVALAVTKAKLDDMSKAGAEAMCLVCPFCAVMYDGNQKSIESAYQTTYALPVLFLTQILGLAMGLDHKALGLNMNVVKTKDLLSRYAD